METFAEDKMSLSGEIQEGELDTKQETDVSDEVNDDAENVEKAPLADYGSEFQPADCTLILADGKIRVHKAILAFVSPVFADIFKDKESELSGELEIADVKAADMNEFLDCLYPTTPKVITADNVLQVLPLVDKYQRMNLRSSCEDMALQLVRDSTDRVYQLLGISERYSFDRLKKECVKIAARRGEVDLKKHAESDCVSAELRGLIYEEIFANFRNELMKLKETELNLEAWKIASRFMSSACPKTKVAFLKEPLPVNMRGGTLSFKLPFTSAQKETKKIYLFEESFSVTVWINQANWLGEFKLTGRIVCPNYLDFTVHGRFVVPTIIIAKQNKLKDALLKRGNKFANVDILEVSHQGVLDDGLQVNGIVTVDVYLLAVP